MNELQGLSGVRRQAVAADLWATFRERRRPAAILVGFSGTGKSERVALPLVGSARAEGFPAVHFDVPARPTQLDQELLGVLTEALRDTAALDLAGRVAREPSFVSGVRHVLRAGGLVVIDEFQRLLQVPGGIPPEPYAEQLQKLARRPPDGGCLWLLTNRNVDPVWSEPFHTAVLEPPDDTADVVRIVVEALGTADAAERLPASRHAEIASRFGRNPRALRLLGNLMRSYALEELIGQPQAVQEGLALEELSDQIERSLLDRAKEGLSNAAGEFLRDLSILLEPAPIGLLGALGAHLGNVQTLLAELQKRFLVDQRKSLRLAHPLVREVELPRLTRDKAAFCVANLRVGRWHAAQLGEAVARSDDAAIAKHLGAVRHHLLAAEARDALLEAVKVVRPYIERRFDWSARMPSTEAERDAQISLLELILEQPGPAAAELHLARRLELRGERDDMVRALGHAARATVGQDFSHPWVLRLQLLYRVDGPQAVIAIGPVAVAAVAPDKGIFSVYQIYGAALAHVGRDVKAIETLLEGAAFLQGRDKARLTEQALAYAAAMLTTADLTRVRDWARAAGELEQNVALANVILHERAGEWRGGAERAQIARRRFPNYLHLALHEAFCWLGAEQPEEAQKALDRFPINWIYDTRAGNTWLAASIALRTGDLARGHALAELYIDGPLPRDAATIERALIREWDTRVATLSEPNPALEFPVLPPSMSGLSAPVIRPQHGTPVLPQHRTGADVAQVVQADRIRILAVGTEWASGQGGLSTFNRQLCIALSASGADVSCLAIAPAQKDIDEAASLGVRLVAARATPGVDEREWLARRPSDLGLDYKPDYVIGHGRITGPAALRLAEDVFPGAKRLHFLHMAPDEIEWHKFDRELPAGQRAEDRTKLELDLAHTAHRAVAVGPRLCNRFLRDLHPFGTPEPLRFDPGFDSAVSSARTPPPGAPWKILLLGRAEDEKLKGLDIAAAAIGRVFKRRPHGLPGIELVVRGAKPADADGLQTRLSEWAATPGLLITVRNYSTDPETLDRDLRSSSLVLMPSRSEGFGLVGLEAIVSGHPILLSSQSGLAELLKEQLAAEVAARVSVEMTGNDANPDPDVDQWANAIEATLRNREASFRDAFELLGAMRHRLTWRSSVQALLSTLVKR
ncbi:glycosyltransferase [Bradyrhizobium sp. 83012]|uniref:Glycosyltransferase n=1 Tax=Bradyrhizobium aeschynomenes TaxID=2734909 RepID=A0ABX2C9E7_9BRAD|nr:glycosyltransferase [Bradyrhizobium aeschynomenes]NPU64673.1 glycosyltransferase [Bradyrhizobium aeschynomenes]